MDRFITLEIAGREYRGCLTSNAMRKIIDRHGSWEKCMDALQSEVVTIAQMDAAYFLVHTYIDEGTKKLNAMRQLRPDGSAYESIEYEMIGTLVDFDELAGLVDLCLLGKIAADEIEVKIKEDPKNASSEVPTATSGISHGPESSGYQAMKPDCLPTGS